MTNFIFGLITGLVVGSFIGVLVMALCAMSGKERDE